MQRDALRSKLLQRPRRAGPHLKRRAHAGRVAEAHLHAAHLQQRCGRLEHPVEGDPPLVGAAKDRRDVAPHLHAIGQRRRHDLADASQALGDGAVQVLLVVGLARRKKDRDVACAGLARRLEPLLVGHERPVAHPLHLADPAQHLRRVCHLRDPLGVHKAPHLHVAQSRIHEPVDEVDLLVGRQPHTLVLQAVTRAHLHQGDASGDARGDRAHRG